MPLNLAKLEGQIQTATMLIGLGISTAEKIRGFFAESGHDDEALAAIMSEVDRRIARRS